MKGFLVWSTLLTINNCSPDFNSCPLMALPICWGVFMGIVYAFLLIIIWGGLDAQPK